MKNHIVYAEHGQFAGWPANHGHWQWGNEFLVGFMRGRWGRSSMHNITTPFEKMLARSRDGGVTWTHSRPSVDFNGVGASPNIPASFDMDRDLVRVCGVYDTGGEECDERGAFYISPAPTRGEAWAGPFKLIGLDELFDLQPDQIFTGRTAVLPPHHGRGALLFYSLGHRDVWGTDATYCASFSIKQRKFVPRRNPVCADLARAVMPAVTSLADGRIVCLLRRRITGRRASWIDAFASDDNAETWTFRSMVCSTGWHNGNPPAVVTLNDGKTLLAAYGDRDFGSINVATSTNGGAKWETRQLRAGHDDHLDIGYPRLFVRTDGTPVCVYYWSDAERPHSHIVATEVPL